MDVTLAATSSSRAAVTLHNSPDDPGRLRVVRPFDESPGSHPFVREAKFPICYQEVELGGLSLWPPQELPETSAAVCRTIAKTLAYHLKRQEVGKLARELYQQELAFIGTSAPLRRLDQFVEQASRVALPVLILGEPGLEGERIALALHLSGKEREGSFVQVNCAALEPETLHQQLAPRVRAADGGTLLLSRLEELERRTQCRLCEILEQGIERWSRDVAGGAIRIRLVATATHDIEERTKDGRFYKALLEQLDFLRLEVEPLKNRKEDIKPLIQHYLRVHTGGEARISDNALEACASYPWPGNLAELSRVTARLAVLAEGIIRLKHLEGYAPHVLERSREQGDGGEIARLAAEPVNTGPAVVGKTAEPIEQMPPEAHHPALRRALDYVMAHFQEKISLSAVAAAAYVSVSHLEYLFHKELGTTFTRYVARYRIERAKCLLTEKPDSAITAVAGDAGFSDLRHFERVFKSLVGCTPKVYRVKLRRSSRAGDS